MTDMMKQHWANRYWGEQKPPESKHDFFDAITTPAPTGDGTVATIRFYGPIDSWGGWWGISAQDVSEVLDALPDTVEQIILRINSPGGHVFEAVSILNMLRAHKARVTAVIDGLAASAASVIAVGCDETVMSPGTQMMIHAPLVFMYGNARELRKEADVLDGIQESLVEIYTAKAGDQDWATLLDEDTYLTAQQTVDLGLADRIAVIPDAGETSTAGGGEPIVITVSPDEDDDEVDDRASARRGGRPRDARNAQRRTPQTPASTESGDPNEKEVAMSDAFKAGVRERLGLTDADASDETVLAALEDQITAPPAPTVPEGAVIVDAAAYEQLQSDAAAGRQAMETINAARRDAIIADALKSGRIAAASQEIWRAQLDRDEEGTKALLAAMPENTVPVEELGHADALTSAEDALYARVYPTQKGA